MEAEVLGIDHIYLAVGSLAASEVFYDRVLVAILGFRKNAFELHGEPHVNYYNRQFGIVIRPARAGAPAHEPRAPGLHHLCLRVEGAADVDRVARALNAAGIVALEPRLHTEYAPDYYATFFEDPDGIRLEITNFRAERRARMQDWEER